MKHNSTGKAASSIHDLVVKKEVLCLELLRPLTPRMSFTKFFDPSLPADAVFSEVAMKDVAYTAAHLYILDHPFNPYKGNEEILDLCLALIDAWNAELQQAHDSGKPLETTEWPPYIMSQVMDMLPESKIGAARLANWRQAMTNWCQYMVPKPFFFTSPNHEAWKSLALYTLGKTLGRPDYQEAAIFQQRQQIRYQTPEGFWEEGRHHGPSLKYSFMQLHAMTRLADLSGDEVIRRAAIRLADFMAALHFPDGSTMACLDGRQPYTLGPWLAVVPGQDLTPQMRELARRSVATQDRYGGFASRKYASCSYWYMSYGMVMLTDGSRYFKEVAEPGIPLPLDTHGTVVEHHTPQMEGGALRHGGFVAAVSGIVSDIPKETKNCFRLQRQNRIDLWHQKTGLILGGGHGVFDQNPPYANVLLDTGMYGSTHFGELQKERWEQQLSYISPRAAKTSFTDKTPQLETHFSHGSVYFTIHFLSSDQAEIRFRYQLRNVQKLAIQLVPVFFRDSTMRIDGSPIDPYLPAMHTVKSCVEVTNTILNGTFRIELIEGNGDLRFRTPLDPLKSYLPLYNDEIFDSEYKQSLLSLQITNSPTEGSGRFRITVS